MKAFGVVMHNGNLTTFDRDILSSYFDTEDLLFASDSYNECDIWIADELAKHRVNEENSEPVSYEKLLEYFYNTEELITDIINTLEGRDDGVRDWIKQRFEEIENEFNNSLV